MPTPVRLDENQPLDAHHVRKLEAVVSHLVVKHAPARAFEVVLEGYGTVKFEPTPTTLEEDGAETEEQATPMRIGKKALALAQTNPVA